MIANRDNKIRRITNSIQNGQWRPIDTSPGWYFYKRVLDQRLQVRDIETFINNPYNIELLYATLACWGMQRPPNTKMRWFEDFKNSIVKCAENLIELDTVLQDWCSRGLCRDLLGKTYLNLNLMQSNTRIVSNSKILHFLFPNVLMPVDKAHTLRWIFDGDKGENKNSADKYLEVIDFSLDVMRQNIEWNSYLIPNHVGNTTIPKLIDNVIWELAEE